MKKNIVIVLLFGVLVGSYFSPIREAVASYFEAFRLIDNDGIPFGVERKDGEIIVIRERVEHEIAEGDFPNRGSVNQFGLNTAVGTSNEAVATISGVYQYLTTPETIAISSTSVADTNNGAGAWEVVVEGLDTSWQPISETVVLQGINNVLTQKMFRRVFRCYVQTVGSTANVGTITVKDSSTLTKVLAQIDPGENQTLMAMYTVPAGEKFFMMSWNASSIQGKETRFTLYFRDNTQSDTPPFRPLKVVVTKDRIFDHRFPIDFVFAEKCDIEIRARVENPPGEVASGFEGFTELIGE